MSRLKHGENIYSKTIIFLLIFLIVSLPTFFVIYTIDLQKKMITTKVSISLNTTLNKFGYNEIDKKSLDDLNSIISNANIINDEKKVIEILNNERIKYIELLTIISILLTVFTVFTIINSILEKSKIADLENSMLIKIDEYQQELGELKWHNIIDLIDKQRVSFYNHESFLFDDNSVIDTSEKFHKFISENISYILQKIKNKEINLNKSKIKTLALTFHNYILGITEYANKEKYIDRITLVLSENILLKIIISIVYQNLSTDEFTTFKNELLVLGPTMKIEPY
jgi:hypothetical protein